jgi:LytS/YehU family sensor histidine kinase
VQLPPGVSNEISNAINDEIADANEHEVATYRKEKSTWLMSLVMISLIALVGVKALMGGKRRAEIKAQTAQQDAERESLKRQVAEAKMQMMQAQIEPHFLFNTLASVEHLIETDPPRASAMQRSLIQYLRAVIPQVRENAGGTNLGREVSIVKEYLTLLKMRMEERLEFSMSIPEGLNSAAFPPMMLQTLVENSIKHGLEPKAEGGKINLSAEITHNRLRVTVADNGLGFGVVQSTSTGVGLQNIRERLALLYQGNYQFIITPNQPSGVSVTIEIPYQFTSK